MFGKIKNWMGIEGAKLRFHVLPSYPHNIPTINGELEVFAKRQQTITAIEIKFYEIYTNGRGDEKRIDEYLLGTWSSEELIMVDDGFPQNVFFKLHYQKAESNMDKIAKKGFLQKGLVGFAKSMKGIKSTYRLEARANVEGVSWQVFTKTPIEFG